MTYKLKCEQKESYLRIRITGNWPSGNPKDIIANILDLWNKHQRLPILLDIRTMKSDPSILGDYSEAKLFAAAGFNKIRRIAIIDNIDREESNRFLETTASNRGIRFQFFYTNELEAIRWLLAR